MNFIQGVNACMMYIKETEMMYIKETELFNSSLGNIPQQLFFKHIFYSLTKINCVDLFWYLNL